VIARLRPTGNAARRACSHARKPRDLVSRKGFTPFGTGRGNLYRQHDLNAFYSEQACAPGEVAPAWAAAQAFPPFEPTAGAVATLPRPSGSDCKQLNYECPRDFRAGLNYRRGEQESQGSGCDVFDGGGRPLSHSYDTT
jgi:hypothetical protein